MVWVIARKELLCHLISLRFAACLVLCAGLSAVSCHLLAGQYGERLAAYQAECDRSREALGRVRVYDEIRPEAHRPPQPLSVLAEGLDRRAGTACTIALEEVPFELTGGQAGNEFAPVFPTIDFATLVSVVLSLLALLLTYDAFAGEREQGTLRMCLANACPRHALLLGKYLGALLALGLSLAVTLVLCLLVICLHPALALTADLLAGTGLIFATALLALSCFLFLGLLVSARTPRSFTSLVVLLFLWMLALFVLPRSGAYVARQLAPAPDRKGIEYQVRHLWDDVAGKEEAYQQTIEPQRLWAAMTGTGGAYPVGWRILLAGNPYPTLEYYRQLSAHMVPLYIGTAEEAWKVRARRQAGLARQQRLAQAFRLVSPAGVFARAAEAIAGTDLESRRRYVAELQAYRRQLIRFLEERDAFASFAFSSLYEPSPEEERYLAATLTTSAQLELLRQKAMGLPQDSEEFRQLLQQGAPLYDQYQKQMMQDKRRWEEYVRQHPQQPTQIDLRGLPVLASPRRGAAQAAAASAPSLVGLALANALLLLAAHAALLRSDVR